MLKNLHKVLPSSSSRHVRNSAESKYAYMPSYDDNKNTVKPMKELRKLSHNSEREHRPTSVFGSYMPAVFRLITSASFHI